MVQPLVPQLISLVKQAYPHMVPLKWIGVSFALVGYGVYKIPISEEAKKESKFLHPGH